MITSWISPVQSSLFAYGYDWQDQKFTGKERDAESGLDYFGARYYGSALGRFTSPDPVYFQARMLKDPQAFNLYAYGRNNPLKYVDPTGEAIELVGSDEQRAKELAALQQAVGKKAGSYLYDNVNSKTGKHYVGILKGGPSGKGADFGSINENSRVVGSVIGSSNVAQLALVPQGTQEPSGHVIGSIDRFLYPAETNGTPNGTRSDIVDGDFGHINGLIEGAKTQDDLVPTLGEVEGHELAHVYSGWTGQESMSDQNAVQFENRVRKNEHREGVRIGHDKPRDVKP